MKLMVLFCFSKISLLILCNSSVQLMGQRMQGQEAATGEQ